MLDHSAALSAHNVIDGAVVVFRTCLFVFCGRSRDVLAYVKSHGLMWTSQWLHDFTMKFNGQFGDGVASETATYATPESYALFAWQLFRPDGESMLRDCIERKSSAAAIANLQHMLSGFGGTGFVAKGGRHTIMNVDVRRKDFQWRWYDYFFFQFLPVSASSRQFPPLPSSDPFPVLLSSRQFTPAPAWCLCTAWHSCYFLGGIRYAGSHGDMGRDAEMHREA